MVIQFNVFGPSVENMICCHVKNTDIIAEEPRWLNETNPQVCLDMTIVELYHNKQDARLSHIALNFLIYSEMDKDPSSKPRNPSNYLLVLWYWEVSHHPPIGAAHAENEHFTYDLTSKVKTKFLGNSVDVYPVGRTRLTLKRDGVVLELVPPPTKVHNLIFGRTWIDSPGEMILTNLTTGDKVVLYFQPCGWFGAGRYEVDGYVYNSNEEPKMLMTGKWNEYMSYQPCDLEGEPLPGAELKEVWRIAKVPENDKFQYTYFAHKLNSLDTAPKKLLASDSRLRPDRYALEQGDLSKAGLEKSSLEERQRAEKRNREAKGHQFTPRWFDQTNDISPTPWGDLEVYSYNGKYTEHRAAVDSSNSDEVTDIRSTEFNPWQYENQAAA
ncbi:hypothetical protein L484_021273 [Morus notabilis]|uniref:Oxysterol-binding protein-related protein 3A n=1 Tax=Morus notabilis TaxID=981085 RepID=W9SG34_9ROSA|nr:hypothetical protein L484_021273 [Morus notabilis]